MSREIRRVPKGFRPRTDETWWGVTLPILQCKDCHGEKEIDGTECGTCFGEGYIRPQIEVPKGDWWMLWGTTDEGHPMTPPFETKEELARYCADFKISAGGNSTATYEQWLAMIETGYAPSFVVSSGRILNGVEAVSEWKIEKEKKADA